MTKRRKTTEEIRLFSKEKLLNAKLQGKLF